MDTLLELNEVVLHALDIGKEASQHAHNNESISQLDSLLSSNGHAEEKDVFGLLCMLHAQQADRRTEATIELLRIARCAEL